MQSWWHGAEGGAVQHQDLLGGGPGQTWRRGGEKVGGGGVRGAQQGVRRVRQKGEGFVQSENDMRRHDSAHAQMGEAGFKREGGGGSTVQS